MRNLPVVFLIHDERENWRGPQKLQKYILSTNWISFKISDGVIMKVLTQQKKLITPQLTRSFSTDYDDGDVGSSNWKKVRWRDETLTVGRLYN